MRCRICDSEIFEAEQYGNFYYCDLCGCDYDNLNHEKITSYQKYYDIPKEENDGQGNTKYQKRCF